LKEDDDVLVLDGIPPPQLHLHMGVVNVVMDVIYKVWGKELLLAWCKRHYIMRRGYQGGCFDGNNAKKILEKLDELAEECPVSCLPLVELLQEFRPIVDGCFGHDLDPNYMQVDAMIRQTLSGY
jgi:hypothetical protein